MSRTTHHHRRQYQWTNPYWRRECIHKPEKQRVKRSLQTIVRGADPEDVYVPDNRHKHFSGYF